MDSLPPLRFANSATEIAEMCPKIPVLARTRKACGKSGCRCARGELHGPYWTLRWREGGVHRRRYVRPAELEAVNAVIVQRRDERDAVGLRTWRQLAWQVAADEARVREYRGQTR